jgi:redox-sensitive bicupin YhaK (pirin superfamily)
LWVAHRAGIVTRVILIQTWLALPEDKENGEPAFSRHPQDSLPLYQSRGVRARVLIGGAFGVQSPVPTASPALYVDIQLDAGGSLPLPPSDQERAVYVVSGSPTAGDEPLPLHHVMTLDGQRSWLLEALEEPARLMLFGGAALPGRRYINWNFVSSDKERIEKARDDWRHQRFPGVPGETEWIPLPE